MSIIIKRSIKDFILFYGSFILKVFIKKKRILLIPPTKLDGSFGDELMVVSFIHSNQNDLIDLYTEKDRQDLYSSYNHVNFRWNGYTIHWYKYKAIIVLGADNMTGSYGEVKPLKKIDILKKANSLGIETRILGFSLKNNSSSIILDKLREINAKSKLYLRDIDSFERARGNSLHNITLVSDLAFLTPYENLQNDNYKNWIEKRKNQGKLIIGICPNAIHANDMGYSEYISDFIEFVKRIDESLKVAFVLLYHDLRAHCDGKSDKDVAKDLFKSLNNEVDCYYQEDILNGIEMKYYINSCDVTITGRMHFGISGLSLSKPMMGITYEDKFAGLQKLFNVEPELSLINDYKNINAYTEVTIEYLKKNDLYKKRVGSALENVMDLSRKNVENF